MVPYSAVMSIKKQHGLNEYALQSLSSGGHSGAPARFSRRSAIQAIRARQGRCRCRTF